MTQKRKSSRFVSAIGGSFNGYSNALPLTQSGPYHGILMANGMGPGIPRGYSPFTTLTRSMVIGCGPRDKFAKFAQSDTASHFRRLFLAAFGISESARFELQLRLLYVLCCRCLVFGAECVVGGVLRVVADWLLILFVCVPHSFFEVTR